MLQAPVRLCTHALTFCSSCAHYKIDVVSRISFAKAASNLNERTDDFCWEMTQWRVNQPWCPMKKIVELVFSLRCFAQESQWGVSTSQGCVCKSSTKSNVLGKSQFFENMRQNSPRRHQSFVWIVDLISLPDLLLRFNMGSFRDATALMLSIWLTSN